MGGLYNHIETQINPLYRRHIVTTFIYVKTNPLQLHHHPNQFNNIFKILKTLI